ncbi:Mitochondrial phosphate carrier protein 1, mitochondrial [Vitis vinifera]|uniref:Mitochondrial phosphate carrier protein 1, mitochondrial n=1 Tax=Vitis vinifera TaxID=29760 RepID=A0A438EL11_VITVI|nr:Mitochondrial phosphate carrier protein 1, mitochondrial [Vitis vinifera]
MMRVEGRAYQELSPSYYGICTVGGMLSAGTIHLAITPLDVLKVNMQDFGGMMGDSIWVFLRFDRISLGISYGSGGVNPIKYNSITSGLNTLWKEQGPSALWRGWSGKLFGYGVQGGCKFGLYEYFKRIYSDVLVDQNRSVIFFVSSASAQVFADVALCPFEAVKVRVQTQPHFAKGLADGFPKLYATEGLSGFYKGLFPLWGRNLPFSMTMFSTFEHSIDFIYDNVIQKKKEDCSVAQQLGVTCLAGYAAGAFGTLISNPADNIVSSLYNKNAENVLQAVKNIGFANCLLGVFLFELHLWGLL